MVLGNLTIRKKLTLMLMFISTAAVMLVGLTTFAISIFGYRQAMINDLESLAQVLGHNSMVALQFNIPEDAEQVLAALEAKSTIAIACLYDAQGEVFALYRHIQSPAQLSAPPLGTEGYQLSAKGIGIFKPIYLNEQRVGTIYLYDDLKMLKSSIIRGLGLFALIMAITLLVAYLFSSRLQKFISGPIQGLARTAKEVSDQGDYSLRARKESKDEVGNLVDAFNKMLAKIQNRNTALIQSEQELKKHRDHLEELVEERTAELAAAKERAEAASRAKSTFLANMSHELRTPLNAILGYAQIFLQRELDPDLRKGLSIIQQSGDHLLTMINDILDTAKIEVGKVELMPAPVQLETFLETIVGFIHSRAETKGLRVELDRPGRLPGGVLADATRLRQVLLNLMNNSVKFTDVGSVVLRVTCPDDLSAAADQSPANFRLRFEVIDTGIGIAADQLARIFIPFEQVSDAVRHMDGTGLGLFISRQLVTLMGGEITVESEPGRGSTFRFEIVVPPAHVTPEAEAADDRVITGYIGPRRKILVVDDIPTNRAMLSHMLKLVGFDVMEAANGRQALAMVQESQPDAILMDRHMPEMDGLTAVQKIRRMPQLKQIPAIAVSASISDEDRTEIMRVGFNGFVPKPLHWPHLATLLQAHLNLEWEYAAIKEGADGEKIDVRSLILPPIEELMILQDLAMMGDMDAIISRTAHIESLDAKYSPFARQLCRLADAFEERQIRSMVKQWIKTEQ